MHNVCPELLTASSGEGTAAMFAGTITAEGRIESKTQVATSIARGGVNLMYQLSSD